MTARHTQGCSSTLVFLKSILGHTLVDLSRIKRVRIPLEKDRSYNQFSRVKNAKPSQRDREQMYNRWILTHLNHL